MTTIYKYLIEHDAEKNRMVIKIPKNAQPISLLLSDGDKDYVYCIVDSEEKETIEKEVIWIGTGYELEKETIEKIRYYTFLGTHKIGYFVWHFWIEPNVPNILEDPFPF